MSIFRYVDRWQETLADLWRADRDERTSATFDRLINRLETHDRELEDWLEANAMSTDWVPVTLTAPWVNYGAPWNTAQIRRRGDVVRVRGLVKSGASGQTVTTLPAGFRPPANLVHATSVDVGAGNVFARLDVSSGGAIIPYFGAGTAAYLSINVSFSVLP